MLAPSMTVNVACGGQFRPSSVPYPTLMSSLLLCVHPLVEGWGGGGGGVIAPVIQNGIQQLPVSLTGLSKVLTEHSSIPHPPFPRSQSS